MYDFHFGSGMRNSVVGALPRSSRDGVHIIELTSYDTRVEFTIPLTDGDILEHHFDLTGELADSAIARLVADKEAQAAAAIAQPD